MQLNIKNKNENSFLKRTEVQGTVTFSGATPSNKDIAAAVGKAVGKDVENVVIRSIKTIFSQNEANVDAVIYHSADAKKILNRLRNIIESYLKKPRKQRRVVNNGSPCKKTSL